jgi:hypothetical protein
VGLKRPGLIYFEKPTMRHQQKMGPRAEFRALEGERVNSSVSLAEKFRALKALTVDLRYFDPEGENKTGEVKYRVNLDHAKSVFRFNCPNGECVRGDFDLSEELGKAVAARRKVVTGEMCCQGWQSKITIDTVRCGNILRFKLSLGY